MRIIQRWVTIGVKTAIPWPLQEVKVSFEGYDFLLLPETGALQPSVAIEISAYNLKFEDALPIARRFFSALAWSEGNGIKETFSCGSSKPGGIGKSPISTIGTTHFDPTYLPVPKDDKQKLALALYREALSVNSDSYKFLGFAKIINMISQKGADQIAWMNNNIASVTNPYALLVIDALKTKGVDIGNHLFVSGRCAIAHAYADPIVDPDDAEDLQRMKSELPLIKALSEIFIEKELKIKTRQTIWKEHLYELDGFKRALPSDLLSEIISGAKRTVRKDEINLRFEIGLRQHPPYYGLSDLEVMQAEMKEGKLFLILGSNIQAAQIYIGLDFKNEKLLFDPYRGLGSNDLETPDSLAQRIGVLSFQRDLIGNGQLQIKLSGQKEILGYADSFIPNNIDPGGTADNINRIIAELEMRIKALAEIGQ